MPGLTFGGRYKEKMMRSHTPFRTSRTAPPRPCRCAGGEYICLTKLVGSRCLCRAMATPQAFV
eukprot:8730067-Heterocapsa_arctica.AAC.1